MPIAAPVGAAIIGGIGALGGAALNSNAANNAANIQSAAAKQAADLQANAAAQALQFQQQQAAQAQQNYTNTTAFNRGVYNTQQANLAPYRALGAGTIAQLGQPIPGGR